MKIAMSKKDIQSLVYSNLHSDLGFDYLTFEQQLRKLFK